MLPERQVPSPAVTLRILESIWSSGRLFFIRLQMTRMVFARPKSSQAKLGEQGWFENTERKAGLILSISQVYQDWTLTVHMTMDK